MDPLSTPAAAPPFARARAHTHLELVAEANELKDRGSPVTMIPTLLRAFEAGQQLNCQAKTMAESGNARIG